MPTEARRAVSRIAAELSALQKLVVEKQAELAAAEAEVVAEDLILRRDPVQTLDPDAASLVFALLPVDSRLRCREVCRGWRAFLADARH